MFLWTQKKCNFHKTAETFWLKLLNFFFQNPEKQWAEKNFRKGIHPHCSSGIVKCSFYNSAGKVFSGVSQFFAQTPEKMWMTPFLWKCDAQKWSSPKIDWNFHFPANNMLLSGQKVFAQCPKTIKMRPFPSQYFSSKLIPRTVTMHVFIAQKGGFF